VAIKEPGPFSSLTERIPMSDSNVVPNKPEDYKLLDLWHRSTGSFAYYITNLQREAALDNAPLSSLYRNNDNEWITFDSLPEDHWFREQAMLANKAAIERNEKPLFS